MNNRTLKLSSKFTSLTIGAGIAALLSGAASDLRADYPSTVLSLNPVAYYRLNETNLPPAADLGTNLGTAGAVGTLYYIKTPTHGQPGLLPGDTNTATAFNGSGDQRAATAVGPSYVPPGPFTVEGWFQPFGGPTPYGIVVCFCSLTGYDGLSGPGPLGPNLGWYLGQNTNNWELVMYNGQLTGTALSLGGGSAPDTSGATTYYVAAVYDGTTASLYVNGVQVASGTPSGYVANTVSQFSIAGTGGGGGLWDGNAQDIALYTNALSAAAILAHYQNGISHSPSPSYPTLVLSNNPFFYYRLNDAAYTQPDPSTFPSATNSASSVANVVDGLYEPGTTPGVAGPPFPGMGANSGACEFNGIVGAVNLQVLNPLPPAATGGPLTLMAWYKATGTSLDTFGPFGGMILAWGDSTWRLGRNRVGQGLDWDCNNTTPLSILSSRRIADGQWHHLVAVYDLTNKWLYQDGVMLATEAASGTINTSSGDEMDVGMNSSYGTFNGRVWNGFISDAAIFTNALTEDQVLQVYNSAQPSYAPYFYQQPQAPTNAVYVGSTVNFSVGVQGNPPPTLQWTLNKQPLNSQTASNLVLTNVSVNANNGSYAIVASNTVGATTSAVVVLSIVSGPPAIVQQPASISILAGAQAGFSVTATGSMPFNYQWQLNSVPIPGATGQTLVFSNVNYINAGTYTVAVSNSINGTLSQPAVLAVLVPPALGNVTEGLVAHYRFDGDFSDTSGHGHNGVPVGSPTFVPGFIGSGAIQVYDAKLPLPYPFVLTAPTWDSVYVGDPTDFQFNAGDSFSVSLWVSYTNNALGTPGDLPIIGNSVNSTYNPGWVLADGIEDGDPGQIECSLDGASFYDFDVPNPAGTMADGNWHHLVMALDRLNAVVNIYIDGALAGSNSAANLGSLNTGAGVAIGNDPTGEYNGDQYPGGYSIDDVGIWRRVLSAAEVAGIYTAGTNGSSFDTFGPVELAVSLTATGQMQISWQAGTLEYATKVTGPWQTVLGANAPVYVVTPVGGPKFYRVHP
jgi:hypothetical protein